MSFFTCVRQIGAAPPRSSAAFPLWLSLFPYFLCVLCRHFSDIAGPGFLRHSGSMRLRKLTMLSGVLIPCLLDTVYSAQTDNPFSSKEPLKLSAAWPNHTEISRYGLL